MTITESIAQECQEGTDLPIYRDVVDDLGLSPVPATSVLGLECVVCGANLEDWALPVCESEQGPVYACQGECAGRVALAAVHVAVDHQDPAALVGALEQTREVLRAGCAGGQPESTAVTP